MKMINILAASALAAAAGWTTAAVPAAAPAASATALTTAPDAARVKAAHDLLAAMQAEKMMRTTAGMSKYSSVQQRAAVLAKLEAMTPEAIYTRLATPVARLLSAETAAEMTRFYGSSYGQRVLYQTYNGKASLYQQDPAPTAKEKLELKRPAYLKASQEFKAAEPAIHHEAFLMLSQLNGK